jgi:hypothetical protein
MANFMGVTSSNGIILDDDQKKQVDALLEKYVLSMEDVQTDDGDGGFGFWGYSWLFIIAATKEGEPEGDEVTDDFLDELSHILHKDQKLIIQCVGNEKCRFPLAAMQIVVTPGEVKITGFDKEEVTA